MSCSERTTDIYNSTFNATVVGKGMDCGNAFLIQFDDNVTGLPMNPVDRIFYAINLPEEYKIAGKRISIEYRDPMNNEVMICTARGPAYPQIFITRIK